MTAIKKLEERVDVIEKQPLQAEPRPWFGFHAVQHSYDASDVRFNIFNRHVWEWFCLLQMNATELDEYVAISVWDDVNGHPLIIYGTPPELQAEAEAHQNRKQELEITAQGRAEELDRKDPEAYPRWKEFYKQLEQDRDQAANDESEPTEPVDDSPGKQMRLLWGWRLQVLEAYRKCEKARSENGEVSK